MQATPLQVIVGLYLLGPNLGAFAEIVIALIFALTAFAFRRSHNVPLRGLVMCAVGFVIDAVATPPTAAGLIWARWVNATSLILVSWGVIYMLLAMADAAAHRTRTHFSTILKDLLMLLSFAVVLIAVLTKDTHVDPTPILASSAVIGVVLGFALQESLGNIFSGLTLQMSRPFAPGDWVRSDTFVGRVQGISWRSTTVVTRNNERLEIPNSDLAKRVVINYSNGVVADEVVIGLSYSTPPNYVREVIIEALRSVPGILQNPGPDVYAWDYADYSIRYRVRYWMSDFADAERLHDTVSSALWYLLRRKSIEIPAPIRQLRMMHDDGAQPNFEAFERNMLAELRQVDFLQPLHEDELKLLIPEVTVQKFGSGEAIVREGDKGDSLFIIRSGIVEVVATNSEGNQVHIRDLSRPAFFGEMALMTGEPRTATVRARTDAELLELDHDGFSELFKTRPEAAARIGEVIALRMTETHDLLANAPRHDRARNRANWLIAKMCAVFDLKLPHQPAS
jgi:small-conductance mechanosensitive channel/CRP-like cAMP-binding protein